MFLYDCGCYKYAWGGLYISAFNKYMSCFLKSRECFELDGIFPGPPNISSDLYCTYRVCESRQSARKSLNTTDFLLRSNHWRAPSYMSSSPSFQLSCRASTSIDSPLRLDASRYLSSFGLTIGPVFKSQPLSES
jgi:hypothetical protein